MPSLHEMMQETARRRGEASGPAPASGGDEPASGALRLDVVDWAQDSGVQIESKDYGRINFEPYPVQQETMRGVQHGEQQVIDKGRQTGISTCFMVALSFELLFRHELRGVPLHAHVSACDEDTALNLLKMSKLALSTARLTPRQRRDLRGIDPKVGNAEISYTTPAAENYIHVHAATGKAGRSYAPNLLYMDEVVFTEGAASIYSGYIGGMDLGPGRSGQILMSSTYDSGDLRPTPGFQFFCDMVDNAEEMGRVHRAVSWTSRPERLFNHKGEYDGGEEWKAEGLKAYMGREWMWYQEHEMLRHSASAARLNMDQVRLHAAAHPWLGDRCVPGHQYAKGVDLAGSGAMVVFYVVDLSAWPCQLIHVERYHALAAQEKIDRIKALHLAWPGPMYVDCTNDPTLPGMLVVGANPVYELTAVHFGSGRDVGELHTDNGDGVARRTYPVKWMESALVTNLERGNLIVHLEADREHFPEVKKALENWRQPPPRADGRRLSRKDLLPNADDRDGLMLANLAINPQGRTSFEYPSEMWEYNPHRLPRY